MMPQFFWGGSRKVAGWYWLANRPGTKNQGHPFTPCCGKYWENPVFTDQDNRRHTGHLGSKNLLMNQIIQK
ncbi:MAG: hypothetical protein A2W90_22715 [Bacteroidetes bacterium GWF2_42_66]|nr:MAG: hypothetical protein A2W92_22120 [Bacteroidetes bacterium GWA2_42_15]OFY03141.1 MAG: hypothetical protein A2W89_13495 [Bacteroidetes bacterium GWE2_42_39]OFY45249.1 MAG: hypothetical protein A2W90_22715 [Bacteroidetes bacterium GWF2_42_66]HAZ02147.1 hypothetical protein [Marinilabiliales bacterium]HBL74090.1 hypothetical protein [Prolixibacteraceae bacterium]